MPAIGALGRYTQSSLISVEKDDLQLILKAAQLITDCGWVAVHEQRGLAHAAGLGHMIEPAQPLQKIAIKLFDHLYNPIFAVLSENNPCWHLVLQFIEQ